MHERTVAGPTRLLARTIGLTLAALAVITGGVWFANADILYGPALEPTPPDISLSPGFHPATVSSTSDARGSPDSADAAFQFADSIGASSVIVLRDGELLAEWGETDRKISAHSVRKSMVGALYGAAVDRGLIDVTQTLAELGIDDRNPSLTEIERSATLEDLLTARSGIYHPSIRDDGGPSPERGSHRPGEAFFYNNWSFNAVGGIFENLTGLSLGDAFEDWIAVPLGMQDFQPDDVRYTSGEESVFPAFRYWMTGRDLARFGQLYLDRGVWNGRQVISSAWIDASLAKHTDNPQGASYGYMWWIMPDGSYLATGTGGQKVRIYPATRTVIVTRVDTGEGFTRALWWNFGPRVNNTHTARIVELLDQSG